ncbi:hypothetical protein AB0G02_00775 [Actinosynnema sp. NPDC023658]|uniref:hypothetical protein n=1 Tax=Actinosynnema sp. NPDC023658 TaxID=3155465 RepID=UPI0033D71E04
MAVQAEEKESRRKLLLSRLTEFGVRVDVYRAGCGGGEEPARQKCLARLVDDLVDLRVAAWCWTAATTATGSTC